MTAREMYTLFDEIIDKYNAPGFDELAFNAIINPAQRKFVLDVYNNNMPSGTEPYNQTGEALTSAERSQFSSEIIKNLMVPNIAVTSDGNGFISDTSIKNELSPKLDGEYRDIIHILSAFKANSNTYCKFVRHNDLNKLEQNSFKKSSSAKPFLIYERNGYTVKPKEANVVYKFNVLVSPKNIDVQNGIDCELPEIFHDQIVFIAVEIAGIATRDQLLANIRNAV